MDMDFDIRKFDSYREDSRHEVIRAQGGLPKSMWRTYSSFANGNGGVIILGVVENEDRSWRAVGLPDVDKIKKDFWDTINDKSKVSCNILTDRDVKFLKTDNGSVIMVIHVPKARRQQKPVYINDDLFRGSYKRYWEGDYHCTREEVLGMLRDSG